MGDEGGFAPNLKSYEEAIVFFISAIKAGGYKPGRDIGIALHPAENEFYKNKKHISS